jgi:hypothetical protein
VRPPGACGAEDRHSREGRIIVVSAPAASRKVTWFAAS